MEQAESRPRNLWRASRVFRANIETMCRSLVPAFTILGATQGWLLIDALSGGFDCSGQPSVCARGWLTNVAVFALAAAAVAAVLARAPTPTIARFVAYFLAGTFPTICIPGLFALHTRWSVEVALGILATALVIALVSLPFFALPFFAWRVGRARPGSLLADVEARGVWIAVAVAVVTATSLTSRGRGWMFNDLVGRIGPPHIGAKVELGLELLALVAMAPLVARDGRDAFRVSRIDPRSVARGGDHARETLDLGVGAGVYVEALEAGASHGQSAGGLAVTGDVERAWRALYGRLLLDAVAVAIGIGALCAFQPITH